ncbi:MAG: ABC transporter permease [Planctomycetota bacterium]|nr:ABC transporter permease [Planctomycetota bacterium]
MYKLLLSVRYFRSRFLAVAALLAITFAVAMLVIVLAIMEGYLNQVQENIRGMESHLQVIAFRRQFGVRDDDELEELIRLVDNVQATAPFAERGGVYQSVLSFGLCTIKGIDPARQIEVGSFGRFVLRPQELQEILDDHVAIARGRDPDKEPAPPDVPAATRAVHELINRPERQDLSGQEVAHLFSREWRSEVLRGRDPQLLELYGDDIPPACLVGIQLLLDRQMYLGQIVTVITISPKDDRPASKELLVSGAIKTGDFDADSGSVYAELGLVKNFLGLCDVDQGLCHYQGIRVALRDESLLEESQAHLQEAIRARYPELMVTTWKDQRRNLLRAVLIEKYLVWVIVKFLVFFTGAMVLLMLLLTVIEKTRDIGVLMSLGATPEGITTIFFVNGLVISLLGTVAGMGLGIAFCTYINDIHDFIYDQTGWSLFKAEIYHMDRIPIAFSPGDILRSTVPPVLTGLLASIIPALWAPRRDPIKAIQYE